MAQPPFRFAGKLQKLTIKLWPNQMSAADEKAKAEALANANNQADTSSIPVVKHAGSITHGVARRPLNRQKATWTNPSKIKSRPLATTADTTLIPKA